VRRAGNRAAKPCGIHVVEPDPDLLARQIDSGFTFLGYSLDIRILDSVCRTHLKQIRETR
jgi:2-dehydro-3-deoxyglucarate aldolase